MKCKVEERGITLIALIITVIILLILAGVAISALGNSGLFSKAKDAVNKYQDAEKNETDELGNYENALREYTLEEIAMIDVVIPIYTKEQLMKISSEENVYIEQIGKTEKFNMNRKYEIMNPINLIGENWIGISDFYGELNGNRYVIDNLNSSTYGLFVKNHGKINAVSLYNININSDRPNLGGLVGENYGEINLSKVRGKLVASDSNIGGIVGVNTGGKITDCYSIGDIKGANNYIGGLTGMGGTIVKSFNFSKVESEDLSTVGGLSGDDTSEIVDSYWKRKGLATFYNTGVELSDPDSRKKVSYVGFDFETIWDITENATMPRLRRHD